MKFYEIRDRPRKQKLDSNAMFKMAQNEVLIDMGIRQPGENAIKTLNWKPKPLSIRQEIRMVRKKPMADAAKISHVKLGESAKRIKFSNKKINTAIPLPQFNKKPSWAKIRDFEAKIIWDDWNKAIEQLERAQKVPIGRCDSSHTRNSTHCHSQGGCE